MAQCRTPRKGANDGGGYRYYRRRRGSCSRRSRDPGEGSLSGSSGPPTCPRPATPAVNFSPATHRQPPPPSLPQKHPALTRGAPFPTAPPRRAPSPEPLHSARPQRSRAPSYHFLALGATVRLPRHGAGLPTPPRHRPAWPPLLTPIDPAAAPQPSGLTGTDSPRLRGLPRGTTGLVVPTTRIIPAQ